MMFDAITNFITYLENSLQQTSDHEEALELTRLLNTAKRLEATENHQVAVR